MPTYTVYVRNEENEQLRKRAKTMGMTPRELVNKFYEAGMSKQEDRTTDTKLDALFYLLEILISEVGYTSGATRAASANIPAAVTKGNELELGLKKAVAQLKARLEKQGAEVRI